MRWTNQLYYVFGHLATDEGFARNGARPTGPLRPRRTYRNTSADSGWCR